MAEERKTEPTWYGILLVGATIYFAVIGLIWSSSWLHDNVFIDSARLDALEHNVRALRYDVAHMDISRDINDGAITPLPCRYQDTAVIFKTGISYCMKAGRN